MVGGAITRCQSSPTKTEASFGWLRARPCVCTTTRRLRMPSAADFHHRLPYSESSQKCTRHLESRVDTWTRRATSILHQGCPTGTMLVTLNRLFGSGKDRSTLVSNTIVLSIAVSTGTATNTTCRATMTARHRSVRGERRRSLVGVQIRIDRSTVATQRRAVNLIIVSRLSKNGAPLIRNIRQRTDVHRVEATTPTRNQLLQLHTTLRLIDAPTETATIGSSSTTLTLMWRGAINRGRRRRRITTAPRSRNETSQTRKGDALRSDVRQNRPLQQPDQSGAKTGRGAAARRRPATATTNHVETVIGDTTGAADVTDAVMPSRQRMSRGHDTGAAVPSNQTNLMD